MKPPSAPGRRPAAIDRVDGLVAAGLVLLLSDRRKARAALTQLTPGALAIVALAIGVTG